LHRITLSLTLDVLGLYVMEIRRTTGDRRPPRSVAAPEAVLEKKAAR
jgi:hypothetical protein